MNVSYMYTFLFLEHHVKCARSQTTTI